MKEKKSIGDYLASVLVRSAAGTSSSGRVPRQITHPDGT